MAALNTSLLICLNLFYVKTNHKREKSLNKRMPDLPRFRTHGPAIETPESVTRLYYSSPLTTLVIFYSVIIQ